ncbi:hypothetical protein WR25_00122 [Diploscapter pachys]|uniref:Activin types I and II receptor domain-containing protein n=1 Tax=Diploscapter pachys TaxID=2018661 RepID=A0A2A2KT71_9BILA|nr:hypothetical protein WR25_00122 [Diploscapter pachys]
MLPEIQAALLKCRLFHEYAEEHRMRTITDQNCQTNNYCVLARYKDPNTKKKQGYSMGCDQVDCIWMREKIRYFTTTKGNLTCIKNADYGRDGEICCCNGYDYCNEFGVNTEFFQVKIEKH